MKVGIDLSLAIHFGIKLKEGILNFIYYLHINILLVMKYQEWKNIL